MPGKFEVYKDKGGEFRFRLKASNGQSILASEGYKPAYVIRSFAPSPTFIRFSYADGLCCFEDRPLRGTKQLDRYP